MEDNASPAWPSLSLGDWRPTCATLHLCTQDRVCTQIVGKTRVALAPPENHSWHTPLYVTPRGLAAPRSRPANARLPSSSTPSTSYEATRTMTLGLRTVADFGATCAETLHALGINRRIRPGSGRDRDPGLDTAGVLPALNIDERTARRWLDILADAA